jgi:hypothetical protein
VIALGCEVFTGAYVLYQLAGIIITRLDEHQERRRAATRHKRVGVVPPPPPTGWEDWGRFR